MHANELIKALVGKVHHHTEGERERMLAAVDEAFPVHAPEADAPSEVPHAAGSLTIGNPDGAATVTAAVPEDPYGTAPMFQAPPVPAP